MSTEKAPAATVWSTIVSDWLASGLSQTAFCQQRDLKSHQLSYYYRKCHPVKKSPTKFASISMKAEVPTNTSSCGFVLAFTTGMKLSIPANFCEKSLQRLLQTIERLPC